MRLSRRALLGSAGALMGAGLTAGCHTSGAAASDIVPFHGPQQAGIITDTQSRLAFAVFDVTSTRRADLEAMLQQWTAAAEAMTLGGAVPGDSATTAAPPADTGEATDLPAARLTLTVGFGPGLFDGRFGLADRRPAALTPLPELPGEDLDPATSGGDIAVQACADDPQVAFHAVRNLARIGRGTVVTRWTQLGFGSTAATGAQQATPRNLLGFKDGTRNIKSTDTDLLRRFVWVGDDTRPAWLRGGTYLVARRIRMFLEPWDRDALGDQQNVIGRAKATGAPLTGSVESDQPDFTANNPDGSPTIPDNAHIRLAAFENNAGLRILRRGYSFTDGVDARTGTLDAGLFFLSYQSDPAAFITLQRKLGHGDALNEYIRHVGSGVFACPPGVVGDGDHWGRALFAP